jgi:hypothetical protein
MAEEKKKVEQPGIQDSACTRAGEGGVPIEVDPPPPPSN